jgi:uncharacterized protein DUF6985
VVFAPEGRDDAPLERDEVALVQWLADHPRETFEAVVSALVSEVPEVGSEAELSSMVELESVHVHQVVAGGLPYLGFALRCDWDEEHGAGVLLHGTRVVEIGGQDTAFLLWIAERDAEAWGRPPG